ncbi:hypothetical protein ASE02_20400 [Phenylobacterium sp. Root700]|nr:hypothetical protein ASE02_20400 [Phenylobacterium sp. Root700]
MRAATFDPLAAMVEHIAHENRQTLRLQQPSLQMVGDGVVELLHRHGDAGAALLADPCLGRAGVVAIAPVLAGAQGHGSAAQAAKADAAQEGSCGDESGVHEAGAAKAQGILHRLELRLTDDRRDRADRVLGFGFRRLGDVVAIVEAMLALVGRLRQDVVHGANPEPATIAGTDVLVVEVGGDGLEAHRSRPIHTKEGEAVDLPDLLRLDRVDLQLLLELGAALFGHDHAIAQRRP